MDWEEYGRGWTSNITEWTGKNMADAGRATSESGLGRIVEAGRATSQSGLGRIWQRLDEQHHRVDWEEYGRGWTSNITE